MTSRRFKPLRLTTKKQRELDYRPWEKKLRDAYKADKERGARFSAKWKIANKILRHEQRRLGKDSKLEPPVLIPLLLRDLYLEVGVANRRMTDLEMRLIEVESNQGVLEVLLEDVANLTGLTTDTLQTELPEAFKLVRKRMSELREGLSKEIEKKRALELKVPENIQRGLQEWAEWQERAKKAASEYIQ